MLDKVIEVIDTIEPFPAPKEFIERLREIFQVVIIIDMFDIFGRLLMRKLDSPTLFHNDVVIDKDSYIVGYMLCSAHTKRDAVQGLQAYHGVETIAEGDGYDALMMIRADKSSFFFRASWITGQSLTVDGGAAVNITA